MNITFSSDLGKPTFKEYRQTAQLAEKFFKTENTKNQLKTSKENSIWFYKNTPDSLNVIRINGKIIGFTFTVLCNKTIMRQFLSKKISEAKLFEKIKERGINENNFETLYFCASVIIPKYQRIGLGTKARVKTIQKLINIRNIKPILFSWPFTKEGEKLGLRVAKTSKLKLLIRK